MWQFHLGKSTGSTWTVSTFKKSPQIRPKVAIMSLMVLEWSQHPPTHPGHPRKSDLDASRFFDQLFLGCSFQCVYDPVFPSQPGQPANPQPT